MRQKRALLLAILIAFILAGLGIGAASEKPDKRVQLSRVATPGASWEGPQFVRADRSGRVFLLRGDKLEVYPIGKDGAAAKPLRLEASGDAIGHVLHAAMSPSGDQWLMYAEGKVRLFVGGKEKTLPPIAWGRDAIYLLVHESGDGLALDRYDTVLDHVERARLSYRGTGRFTLASGKDGLYMAPLDPAEGLWRISWADLESVVWEKVEEPGAKSGR